MKILCFGTFARVLRECCLPSVSDVQLVGALTKSIDPSCEYGESEGTAVSRLLSCTQNLSNGQRRRVGQRGTTTNGNFTSGFETNRLSNVILAAQKTDKTELAKKIAEDVIPLLHEDRKALTIPALMDIIKNDPSTDGERKQSFIKFMGTDRDHFLNQNSFILSDLYASILLYVVLSLKNTAGKEYAKEIDTAYLDSFVFESRDYTFTDAAPKPMQISTSESSNRVIDVKPIKNYLFKLHSKYNDIKTLLYSEQPKPFYSFYVCNAISRKLPIKEPYMRLSYRTDILKQATAEKISSWTKYAILTGSGGIGKSMMLRHLLLDAINSFDSTGIVPIFVSLKDYDDSDVSVFDFIFRKIDTFGSKITQETLGTLLDEGKCLLLFDGLDEISTRYATLFEKNLESFLDHYPINQYIISSRPYRSFVSYNRFTVLSVQPFSKAQALELIDKLEFRPDEPAIKEKFRNELDTTLFYTHREFTENPLLLTIMLMTFEQFAEVPSKMHIFYREAFIALSQKHDASKGAYKRILKTGLTADKFADYFAEFCSRTYHDEKFELTDSEFEAYFYKLNERTRSNDTDTTSEDFLYDLCTNMCLMYLEGNKYHFTHRSFQEYFCALYFSKQKDRNLLAIGDFFENRRSRNYGDKTFMMLYDMIPAKVDEYIFIPYLKKLLAECECHDGYWTFLKIMYPQILYEHGETDNSELTSPVSYIYEFIKRTFFDNNLDLSNLPFENSLVIRKYGYMETDDGDRSLIDLSEIPYDYVQEYGEPDPVGWALQIDIEDIRRRPYAYKELLGILESDDFLLKKEYLDAQRCLETLQASLKPKGDSLFDLFS